jgi:hypothetical protein
MADGLPYRNDMRIYEIYMNLAGAALALTAIHGAALATELGSDLRQEVISICTPDAYRLCPQSLSSVSDAAACMRRKHAQLTPTCRVTFDRVVRVLAQK